MFLSRSRITRDSSKVRYHTICYRFIQACSTCVILDIISRVGRARIIITSQGYITTPAKSQSVSTYFDISDDQERTT